MNMTEIEARGKIKYRIANEMRKAGENKEEYEDLEIALQVMKEIREYRAMEERLNGISVEQVVDGFIKQVENETQEEYKQGRILTNKEAEDWNEYRAIGTVEGYERAIKSSIENYNLYREYKAKVQAFEAIGTVEELKALKEKNEPKKPVDKSKNPKDWHIMACPRCEQIFWNSGQFFHYEPNFCGRCGQKLDWKGGL